jgi:hypothetical protein
LLHAETLLVVTTHDLEDVTLPFLCRRNAQDAMRRSVYE